MITSADEGPMEGGDGFADAVAVDVWDGGQDLFAAIRVSRLPARGMSAIAAVVAIQGESALRVAKEDAGPIDDWAVAAVEGVQLGTREPLQHWDLRITAPGITFECELRAASVPIESQVAGLRRYVQLCEVNGSVSADGNDRRFAGRGVRAHSWGEAAGAKRRRFLHAATEDGALVSVFAARPPGATTHGEELVAGLMVDPSATEAHPFEEVRVSTVFDAAHMPRKAGLELYRPGDELPTRLSGESAWGVPIGTDGGARTVSFFRWMLEGRPGWGTYEQEAPA